MKLKATKYLLPTTDGRLHKEIEYLISLHENKMNKGKLENRISDLENKVNEMSHALSMVYDRVEPIEDTDSLFGINNMVKAFTTERVNESIKDLENEIIDKIIKENTKDNSGCFIKRDDTSTANDDSYDAYKHRSVVGVPKEVEERFKEALNDTPTPELITSTTLKTPNEWLRLMSEEEVRLWRENRSKSEWELDMNEAMKFEKFINFSFRWIGKAQEQYWQNISNCYNN